MDELFRAFAGKMMTAGGSLVLFLAPFMAIAWLLHRRRKRFRGEALEPFTELPLRPPGESLRLKIETLTDEFDTCVTVAAMVGTGSAVIVISVPETQRGLMIGVLLLVALGTYVAAGRRLFALQKQLWDYRLGFTGERVVGEELNQLMTAGFRVFHDVPFDRFNIDHVLVGPPGVYAIETKSARKSAKIKGMARAIVYSDGEVLKFPTRMETRFIPQARLNAQTLSTWLASATGKRVPVKAILTLPGWRIERTKAGDVNVLRPDEIKRSFKTNTSLSQEEIQQIAHQLTERCRLKD